ncbi:MAG: ATP-dependent DNA helicase RecG [Saprospiraceae bacterium]|nr:ATP-dependent DNA helicase RecG [Saprospiraceae bacterium]
MSYTKLNLNNPIEYVKGIGPNKGSILREQLNIQILNDLIHYYPFRYIDKSKITPIAEAKTDGQYIQIKGILNWLEEKGFGKSKRMIGFLEDESGSVELMWFQNYQWILQKLIQGKEYIVYGKINIAGYQKSIAHPEIELFNQNQNEIALRWDPVYSSNEKLNSKGLDTKGFRRILLQVFQTLEESQFVETLPDYILHKFRLQSRYDCLYNIHFPKSEFALKRAQQRLKFEELFFMQLRMLQAMLIRKNKSIGYVIQSQNEEFLRFYNEHLPFQLTNAQNKVLAEIQIDLKTGKQMNRLLQGDVGSGKTIIALLVMLLANTQGFQCVIMAPTEVLAMQHFQTIKTLLEPSKYTCALLTSNIKGKERDTLLTNLKEGNLSILIGTHAVLEDSVQFKNLGLVVIDEQHRFGVEQRARLWAKSKPFLPHVLVMTATPIPRTLAMSLYGDLDVSIIDELPPDRKPIKTLHFTEILRGKLFQFMETEIKQGRQIYFVFPLIEESEKLDLENLELGYEKLLEYFPIPKYQISVVHGRLRPKDKESEMQRFIKGITQVMVATTVIEVGVNVPNASLMVIENAERFGLSQLHQLRGRVGRGPDQSYCILMTADHLSPDAKARIQIMCKTNDGFLIAEEDLRLRGPGDLEGKQQSGLMQLKIADIMIDQKILYAARRMAEAILKKDPELKHPLNTILKNQIELNEQLRNLAKIS